jgi:hypothetical protein
MYIATPPSELQLMEDMRKELKKINPKLTILFQADVSWKFSSLISNFFSFRSSRLFEITTKGQGALLLRTCFGKFWAWLSKKFAFNRPFSSARQVQAGVKTQISSEAFGILQ